MARCGPVLVLALLAGCSTAHVADDAALGDAAIPDAALVPDAAVPDAVVGDTGPRPDADIDIRSRCAAPPHTVDLAVSFGGACRVDDTGQLWCWGENGWGQVRPGGGTIVEPHEVAYAGLDDVVSVADSGSHRCVLHRDGGVSCWGANFAGEVGPGANPETHPVRVAGISGADRVVVAPGRSCARVEGARWLCWGGAGYFAQAFGAPESPTTTPFELPRLRGARAITMGGTNSAALFDDGHVEAVAVPESRIAHAYRLQGIDDATDVVAFDSYVCVVRRSGRVWCAGSESVAIDPPPSEVPGLTDALAFARVSASFYEACVVTRSGGMACWTMARPPAPWSVPGAVDVDLAAMGAHLCALTCGDQVLCNGRGWRGENGDDATRIPPSEIPGLLDATAIDGNCALRADGTVACWDQGSLVLYGEPCPAEPGPLEPQVGLGHVTHLEDGAALEDDGSIVCVGTASTVGGLPAPPIDAACTSQVVLAITADGRLFDWVSGPGGGALPRELPVPAPAVELTRRAFRTSDGRVLDVECADFLGVVCSVGEAWPIADAEAMWSDGGGPLGGFGAPTTVMDCVRHASGQVDCRFMGAALDTLPSRLGIPTPAFGAFVHVPVLDGARDLSLDGTSVCARAPSGAVECWGAPERGRLGSNDPSVAHTTPVSSDAVELTVGTSHCARRADGHVVCWGLVVGGYGSGALCPRPLDRVLRVP